MVVYFKYMYISIDFGGTNTRIASISNLDDPKILTEPLKYRNKQNYELDFQSIINGIKQVSLGQTIEAIGICTPGLPNAEKTHIESAVNIPHWDKKPLTKPLLDLFKCPVFYDNDSVASAIAEVYYADQGTNFHYIVWGTGIGGAGVDFIDKNKFEVIKLSWSEHFSSWEKACSGASLTARYNMTPEDFDKQTWDNIWNDFQSHLREYTLRYSPKTIVFGSGIAFKNAELLRGLGAVNQTEIKLTQHGLNSGLMGGFGLIKYNL